MSEHALALAGSRMKMDATAGRRFVFVGGLHRSGTTLLTNMLLIHPDAAGMSTRLSENEGQFLQSVYLRDAELGGAGRFAFDPRANRGPCNDPVQAAQLRHALLDAWNPHWDTSKRFMVEKTPGNCLHARFLQSVFGGDAQFVFITRHPLANALATRKWSRTSLFALIEHWLHAHELMRAQFPLLRRVAWIAYENLIADPAGTLAGLHHFLGMTPSPANHQVRRGDNERYFAMWQQQYHGRIARLSDAVISGVPMAASSTRRTGWRLRAGLRRIVLRGGLDVLSTGREAGAIIAHYEPRVQALGYSLIDTRRQPPPAQFYAPGHLTSFNHPNADAELALADISNQPDPMVADGLRARAD